MKFRRIVCWMFGQPQVVLNNCVQCFVKTISQFALKQSAHAILQLYTLLNVTILILTAMLSLYTGSRSKIGNVSGYSCVCVCVWLQIQGSRVWSRPGPILSWRLIMKLFLRSFSSLPLNHSRRFVVSYKRKYVHEVLVYRLFGLPRKKCG